MAFLTEAPPERGTRLAVAPGISRIVANNPGLMTYHGTNTYLIEASGGFVVLDPGPADEGHLVDIIKATGGAISAILLSHSHSDHLGATAALKARTDAATYAFHLSGDPGFSPDVLLQHGDVVEGMTAIHTPGHASDHLCFARTDGVLFSADHVMSWSSSVVSPPGGSMSEYCASLRMILARDETLFLPGHGPPLFDPMPYVQSLLEHRLAREEEIRKALEKEPLGSWELVDRLYSKRDPKLRRAAERNVCAHLIKLEAEHRVARDGEVWLARG